MKCFGIPDSAGTHFAVTGWSRVTHQLGGCFRHAKPFCRMLWYKSVVDKTRRAGSVRGICPHGLPSQSALMSTMAPPRLVACPSIYLVVEWVTISAPHSNGRQLMGLTGVIHNQGTPCLWTAIANFSMSEHIDARIEMFRRTILWCSGGESLVRFVLRMHWHSQMYIQCPVFQRDAKQIEIKSVDGEVRTCTKWSPGLQT